MKKLKLIEMIEMIKINKYLQILGWRKFTYKFQMDRSKDEKLLLAPHFTEVFMMVSSDAMEKIMLKWPKSSFHRGLHHIGGLMITCPGAGSGSV